MVHYIYKITCLCGSLAGHYYIGKHSTSSDLDYYAGSGRKLKDYYKKYGKKNGITFTKEILEYNDSFEKNMDREREILGDLWKTDPLCLNLCNGGYGPKEFHYSEETRKKMSLSHKGIPTGKKGTPLTKNIGHVVKQETRDKISKANSGNNNGMYGKTPWNKGKSFPEKSGENHPLSKQINQYSLDGQLIRTWPSLNLASKELNANRSHIYQCCKGKRNKAYGYKWSYASDSESCQ